MEAAPIRYMAEVVGDDTDRERAMRWLIAFMVLCREPLAIALMAVASAATMRLAAEDRKARTSATNSVPHGGIARALMQR
jgi:hypothetical protein